MGKFSKNKEARMNTKETKRYIARHKARLLTNLEEAGCPVVFVREVKDALDWLRNDLTETTEGHTNEEYKREANGNR